MGMVWISIIIIIADSLLLGGHISKAQITNKNAKYQRIISKKSHLVIYSLSTVFSRKCMATSKTGIDISAR